MDDAEKLRYDTALKEARRVFGNSSEAKGWLQEPSVPLGGVTPASLLNTDDGLNIVLYELSQMEYGHPV